MIDLTVSLHHGCETEDGYSIAFIQAIEKSLDGALRKHDFERIGSTKGNKIIEFNYELQPRCCDMSTLK